MLILNKKISIIFKATFKIIKIKGMKKKSQKRKKKYNLWTFETNGLFKK